jgi:outer membrane receptor protein involved in Fe transport
MPALTGALSGPARLAASLLAAAVFLTQGAAAEEQPPAPPDEPLADTSPAAESRYASASIPIDSGVAVQTLCTNCNNADLSISGMGNEHVSVVCDGVPVPSGLAQIYLLSVMPQTRIDKVEVRRGAGDPGYLGAAVGGGIEIERSEPQEKFRLNASADGGGYGWRAGRLDASGVAGWFGGYVVASWSESDAIDSNDDGFENLPQSERYTIEAGLDMKPSEAHRIRVGTTIYDEDQVDGPAGAFPHSQRICTGLEQVIFQNEPCAQVDGVGYNTEDVQLEREQVEALYDVSIGASTKLSLAGLWGERSQDIQETNLLQVGTFNVLSEDELQFVEDTFGLTADDLADLGLPIGIPTPDPTPLPAYFIDDENYHGSIAFSRSLGQQAALRAGGSRTGYSFEAVDVRLNEARAEIPGVSYPPDTALTEEVTETGYWVEGDTALGSRVELSAGARYVDYRYEDNEEEISALLDGLRDPWLEVPLPEGDRWLPRAALTWRATNDLRVRVSAGAGFRAPAPAFDKVCCGRQYRGNRGVRLEESRSAGIELTYQPGPRWRVGGSWFLTDFDDLIVNMATQSDQWRHVYQNVNISEARNESFTVEGKVQAPQWLTTSVSYTWLDPQNRAPDGEITALVDTGSPTPVERTFAYDEIPYATEGRGALGLAFRLPARTSLSLAAQFTGPTWIQSFNTEGIGAGVDPDLAETESFWVANVRVGKDFRNGVTLYAGVDNAFDYVQGDGCTYDEALDDPGQVGCLGDPRYDYNWGPLRGRYYYAGAGYAFGVPRGSVGRR